MVIKDLAATKVATLDMTAHIIYEALDPVNPATLSEKVIEYIRNKMDYKGYIVSDAIDMKALTDGIEEITQRTFGSCMMKVLESIEKVSIDKFADLFVA